MPTVRFVDPLVLTLGLLDLAEGIGREGVVGLLADEHLAVVDQHIHGRLANSPAVIGDPQEFDDVGIAVLGEFHEPSQLVVSRVVLFVSDLLRALGETQGDAFIQRIDENAPDVNIACGDVETVGMGTADKFANDAVAIL